MQTPVTRAALGFVAAAIGVLTFHQAMWEVLHLLAIPGLTMPPPYPMDGVAPWGVPRIISLCFWGGLYGVVFGWLLPRFTWPLWVCGLLLGVSAVLMGNFVVAPIKGLPVGSGWVLLNWVRSLLINGFWGIGVAFIASWMISRERG